MMVPSASAFLASPLMHQAIKPQSLSHTECSLLFESLPVTHCRRRRHRHHDRHATATKLAASPISSDLQLLQLPQPSQLSSTACSINLALANDLPAYNPLAAPVAVIAALILIVAAQSWINTLLTGDQGLGSFLKDGTGYNKSGFQPRKKRSKMFDSNEDNKPLGGGDPMPWLKLPQLDFVEVAGQLSKPKQGMQTSQQEMMKDDVESQAMVAKMELLMVEMKLEVQMGNLAKAKQIENELEQIMKKEGYDFSS